MRLRRLAISNLHGISILGTSRRPMTASDEPALGRRLRFRIVGLLVLTVVFAVGFLAIRWTQRTLSVPYPIRVLKRHQGDILTYFASIKAGRIPEREAGNGYYLLDVLADSGATYVQQQGDCMVITFEFMPTDAVPQLVHCPHGVEPLPAYAVERKAACGFFEWTLIEPNWAYCRWNP